MSSSTTKPAEKTKFFRIAVEGATTDGRTILREWIQEAADNYDPEVYGARINLEHIRGTVPGSPFDAYGDVLELKAEELTGKFAGKLGLFASIKPNANLLAMNKAGQKVYTSCEFKPDFADVGGAYLVGLAVTDNPASLGTQMLTFSAANPEASPLAKRKQDPDNVFTAATEELVIELEEPEAPSAVAVAAAGLLTKLTALLGKGQASGKAVDQRFADVDAAVMALATHSTETNDKMAATIAEQGKTITALKTQLDATVAKLSKEPSTPARPLAKGGLNPDAAQTDC